MKTIQFKELNPTVWGNITNDIKERLNITLNDEQMKEIDNDLMNTYNFAKNIGMNIADNDMLTFTLVTLSDNEVVKKVEWIGLQSNEQ